MTVSYKILVCFFPGFADTGSLAIGYSFGVDCVGIVMIQHKNVVVAATGGDREASRLIQVRAEEVTFGKKHDTQLMGRRFEWWFQIFVDGGRKMKRGLGRSNVLSFLILMAKSSSNALGQVLGDKIDGQSRDGDEVSSTDGAQQGGRSRAAKSSMEIDCQFAFGFVSAKDCIGLMNGGT